MSSAGSRLRCAKEALAIGPKSTRELAWHLMQSKGLDTGDKVLAKAVASQLIHSFRMQSQRGRIVRDGKKRDSFGLAAAVL
jgi:hypothetical protein